MNAAELRELQAPLKQRYRETPQTARVVSRAEAVLSLDDIACTVPTWRQQTVAGLHETAGGSGAQACSADMLVQALVGCAGVTLRAVATAHGVTLRSGRVIAEGVWDARGTLGIDKAVPIGITELTLRFEIDSDADDAKLARMIEATERYCVVLQTLKHPPAITVTRA